MKRLMLLSALFLILLASCSSAPQATNTPVPPTVAPTATPMPMGFSGKVEYTGTQQGNILILAMDKIPAQNENPSPVAIETYMSASGEFSWELPAGTYYVTAFFTIGRDPQGPPLPNEPAVFCNPIQLGENEHLTLYVPLTDADAGGVNKDCVVTN